MSLPRGVTVFCDPCLSPALGALRLVVFAQAGAAISILSAPALSMLAQIERHTRNDVLFSLGTAMDLAVASQLVKPATRIDGFSNALVLAGLRGGTAEPAGLPGRGKIAVTDNTVASGLDGRAVLAANGLTAAAGDRVIGAANTADAAFLVTTGVADVCVIYLTEVKADPRLVVIASLASDPALTSFSAAVNAKAVSPDARALLDVMRGAQGRAVLQNAGLESG